MSSDKSSSPADLQSQLLELQKRFGGMPVPPELPGTSSAISGSPRRSRVLMASNSSPTREAVARKRSHATTPTSKAVGSPSSPGRVDFLSDLSDGLLVESRRLAYENKQYKKQLKTLQAEKEKYENQASNLAVLNTKLSEKEESSGDRIWELETELGSLKEKLDTANLELGKVSTAKVSLETRVGEVNTSLEAIRAEKMQLETDYTAKVNQLSSEAAELRQSNADLNDENDNLQRKVSVLAGQQGSVVRSVDFSDVFKDIPAVGDDSEADVSLLLEPEPLETAAAGGNTAELERQTLQSNLNHALATIAKLRHYILRQRQAGVSPLVANTTSVVSPAAHTVSRRLFKSSPTHSPASKIISGLSPASKKSRVLVTETGNKEEEEGDWEKYEESSRGTAKLADIPKLVKTDSEEEMESEHEALADELGEDLGNLSAFESSPSKKSVQSVGRGLIAVPKGGDISKLDDYDLVTLEKGEYEKLKENAVGFKLVPLPQYKELTSVSVTGNKLTHVQAELEEKVSELQSLKQEVQLKASESEALEKTVGELKVKTSELRSQMQTGETEINSLREQLAEAEKEAVAQRERASVRTNELQSQMQTGETEIASLRNQLAEVKKEAVAQQERASENIAAKERSLNEVNKKLENPDASYVAGLASVAGLIAVPVAEHKKAQKTVADHKFKISQLEGKLSIAQSESMDLRQKLDTLQSTHEAPNIEYVKQKASAAGLVTLSKAEYQRRSEEVEQYESQLSSFRAKIDEFHQDAATRTKEDAEKSQQIATLKSSQAEKEKESAAFQAEISLLQQQTASLKKDLSSLEAELSRAKEANAHPDPEYIKKHSAALGLATVPAAEFAAMQQTAAQVAQTTVSAGSSVGKSLAAAGVAGVAGVAGLVSLHGRKNSNTKNLEKQLTEKEADLARTRALYENPGADYIKSKSSSVGLVAIPSFEHAALMQQVKQQTEELKKQEKFLQASKKAHGEEAVLLKQLLQGKEKKVQDKTAELEAKVAELEDTKTQLQSIASQLQTTSSELESSTTQLQEKIAEVENLTAEHRKLGEEMEQMQKKHSRPDEDYIKSKAGELGLVAVTASEHEAVAKRAAEKEKTVAQLNAAITQLNTEYSAAMTELGEVKEEQKETGLQLTKALNESANNEQLLADKANRIAELNGDLENKTEEALRFENTVKDLKKRLWQMESQLMRAQGDLKASEASRRASLTSQGLSELSSQAGLLVLSKKGYKDLLTSLSLLGGGFKPFAENLQQPSAAEFEAGAAGLKSTAQQQAQMLAAYQSPSIDYLRQNAANLGMKMLTMGEYLDLKDAEKTLGESEGEDQASVVSEEAIDEEGKELVAKSRELEELQEQLQAKERAMSSLQESLAGDAEGENENSVGFRIGSLKKQLEAKHTELLDVQSALEIKAHELEGSKKVKKRMSLQQMSAVDEQLDDKKRELQRREETLKQRSAELSHEKGILEDQMKGQPEVVGALRTELARKNDSLDAVNAELDAKQSALRVLEAYIASNKKDAETAEKDTDDSGKLEDEVTGMRNQVADKEEELDQLNNKLEGLIASYAPELSQRDSEIQQLKSSLSLKAAEVRRLESQVQAQQKQREQAEGYVAKSEYESLRERFAERGQKITHLEAQIRNTEIQQKAGGLAEEPRPASGFISGLHGLISGEGLRSGLISSESLHPVRSVPSSATTSDYVDAVSNQGEFEDLGIDEGEGVHTESAAELRDRARKMGYDLVPLGDLTTMNDQATMRSEESETEPNTTVTSGRGFAPSSAPTSSVVSPLALSLPVVQSYATSHNLTLLPTSQVTKLLHHSVTSHDLAAKAAEYSLALIPESELNELKRRAPATEEQIAAAADSRGLLCIPESQFVPTTVCREPDPANVVVIPISYYTKLTRSHDWYKQHRNQSRSITGGESIAPEDSGRQAAQSSGVLSFSQQPPVDSPAFALSQLARNGLLETASLHTVNTVISTKREMVAAITQTIIGEYLFKYFRKLGPFVSSVSDTRHERYFWIHPYSLTLYWSTSNPSLSDPSETKIKALAIDNVKSVTDNNPLPPGLYHKSIIVSSSDGRSVKLTCPTRQRHNIWYNSIRYLLQKSTEGLLDDDESENQYNETFTMDQRVEMERSQSFRHQQPRSSILGTSYRFTKVSNTRRSSESSNSQRLTGAQTTGPVKRYLATLSSEQ
ncbi:DEKNAAC103500 [Brettanomyces naardenensis]|uniref:DEKNAAC103500 n=1 Tax=Brettanomyces naardenensis TaxID=13370 RepID=A0A448YNX7_BRENA|nr:DEKNAAC103500 [Brettanomyces naardenensis]